MDFKDFINLLKKERTLFLGVVAVCVGLAVGFQFLRPTEYRTVVSLHIARTVDASDQSSHEYRYGDFYRLQADEKFADTVVRWLLSPGIVLDILEASGEGRGAPYGDLARQFEPKRLSSQFIEVRFSSSHSERGEKIATALRSVLNTRAQELNAQSSPGQDGWFSVVVDDPVTYRHEPDYLLTAFLAGIVGVFLGAWVVLLKEYFR